MLVVYFSGSWGISVLKASLTNRFSTLSKVLLIRSFRIVFPWVSVIFEALNLFIKQLMSSYFSSDDLGKSNRSSELPFISLLRYPSMMLPSLVRGTHLHWVLFVFLHCIFIFLFSAGSSCQNLFYSSVAINLESVDTSLLSSYISVRVQAPVSDLFSWSEAVYIFMQALFV